MKRRRHLGIAVAALMTPILGVTVGLPILAMGIGGFEPPESTCRPSEAAPPADETPSITGRSTLTIADITSWWSSTGRRQPSALALPVDDVIALYLSEADAEGVRGDLTIVQAIYETGWFTSDDAARNNFAGIGHHDDRASGDAFPNVATGVRAHVQLLKKYTAGNGADLVRPDVAPDAAARATTWAELAGTWATAPDYWDHLSRLYAAMLAHAGHDVAAPPMGQECAAAPSADEVDYEGTPGNVPLATAEGITVHSSIASEVARLVQAARADGYTLTGGGYRDPQRQIELREQNCGTSQYAIYEMPSSQCSPPTARPGTSNHELGLAVDFECDGALIRSRSTACFAWLDQHAATYGLYPLASEPWHWSVDGS